MVDSSIYTSSISRALENCSTAIKSSWYYLFWAIMTAAVVTGQLYVGTSYKAMSNSIEKLPKERIFDTIVARAYGSLLRLYEDVNKNLGKDGKIVSMKGRLPKAEIDMLPEELDVSIKKLDVPSLSAERHAIIIRIDHNRV